MLIEICLVHAEKYWTSRSSYPSYLSRVDIYNMDRKQQDVK